MSLSVVTGAFSFTGKYIARRLLERGERVRTLTGHPDRPDPFGGRVEVASLAFDDPEALRRALSGAVTLYNTYWIRFEYRGLTFAGAVRNSRALFEAARAAGVERIVHVSVANPSRDSPLPYFRGKAEVERALAESGVSHAILRPTVIFAPQDILINNIAWLLRRFPLFAVPGDGRYPVQPIYADDVAALAVELGRGRDNVTVDAAGPEVFTYEELVRTLARAIGRRVSIVHVAPRLALLLARALGAAVGDVVITGDEIRGLMAGLLVSHGAPTGTTRLSAWLQGYRERVGRRYASKLGRHYRR